MKILWITNILFPDICKELGLAAPVVGGWMKSSAAALLETHADVELAVAACYRGDRLLKKNIGSVTYFCLPSDHNNLKYDSNLENIWREVYEDFKPDVTHIHGTEYAHGLAFLRAFGANNVVISIQGFVSAYRRYETAGINHGDYCRNASLRHIIKGEFTMKKRGVHEVEYIQLAKHVIGRTDWDKAHVWAINPSVEYHFCNETLRKPFYSAKWNIAQCEQHRIFLSQASYPLKGLHQVIRALPYVLRQYPDTKVYIAGSDFIALDGFKGKLRTTTYANIIRKMTREYGIEDKFTFTGPLNEYEMVKQFEKAHMFICPSSIENSPNSLGEAQLVGTPCIASFVGGVPNMVEHGKTGLLYRFEEAEMLAKYICDIFADDNLANHLSENGRLAARVRHDERTNADTTYQIYNDIKAE